MKYTIKTLLVEKHFNEDHGGHLTRRSAHHHYPPEVRDMCNCHWRVFDEEYFMSLITGNQTQRNSSQIKKKV